MGWLIILLGGALSAIGGLGIYYGWEISDIDRGSSQLIAGSVGLSGGIITIALGFVLLSLRGMRRDLRRGVAPRPAPVAETTTPADRSASAEPAPQPPAPERKKRKDRAAGTRAERPPPSEERPPATLAPPLDPSLAPVAVAADAGAVGAIAADHVIASPDPGRESQDRQSESSRSGTASHPSLDDLWPIREKGPPPSYERLDEEIARMELAGSSMRTLAEADGAVATPDRATAIGQASSAMPAPADEEPTSPIVGQYEAGGVSYIMYADGSIRADTPNGVFRFSNINELKSFIHESGPNRA